MRITLPPPRILSIDISRFETINEEQGFLNAIAPEDRNSWYAEARSALEKGALAQGALDRAQNTPLELFEAFVGRHGYTLVIEQRPVAVRATADEGRTSGEAPAKDAQCCWRRWRRRALAVAVDEPGGRQGQAAASARLAAGAQSASSRRASAATATTRRCGGRRRRPPSARWSRVMASANGAASWRSPIPTAASAR